MRSTRWSQETVLETGIVVSFALVLGAFGAIGIGSAVGSVLRSRRNEEPQPEPGSIEPTRHQQIAVASPR